MTSVKHYWIEGEGDLRGLWLDLYSIGLPEGVQVWATDAMRGSTAHVLDGAMVEDAVRMVLAGDPEEAGT